MQINRRKMMTLSATTMGGLGMVQVRPVLATSTRASELTFPEPAINQHLRKIGGLSRRAYFMRQALLQALDDYRAFEARARGGDPDAKPFYGPNDEGFTHYHGQVGTLRMTIDLSQFKRDSDRQFRDVADLFGTDNNFWQIPPDNRDALLCSLDDLGWPQLV